MDDQEIWNELQYNLKRYGDQDEFDGFKKSKELRKLLAEKGIVVDEKRINKILGRE